MLNQDSRSKKPKPQKGTTLEQSSFKAIKDAMAAVSLMLSHVREEDKWLGNVQIYE